MPPGMLQEQADSFFVQTSTPTVYQTVQTQQPQSTRIRPLDEIVSSVQGTFNFLQESLIEVDCESFQFLFYTACFTFCNVSLQLLTVIKLGIKKNSLNIPRFQTTLDSFNLIC